MRFFRVRSMGPVFVAVATAAIVWVGAGDLNPPAGTVGATMKTLAEVEPRTLIHASDMPLNISSPGSYYFAGNITTAGGGITINSDDVTIDLMGFTFTGGTGSGIYVPTARKNITIKRGVVRGWELSGVYANQASHSHFQDLIVSNNGTTTNDRGLGAGEGCVIRNCTAVDNGGDGFWLGQANVITGCTSIGNGRAGIKISSGTVKDCTARGNESIGIQASGGAIIEGCISTGSLTSSGILAGAGSVVKNCSATSNAVDGIVISFGEVRDCACYNNDGDGIQAGFNSTIVGNSCTSNDGAGINVAGRRTRIEGNNVLQNGTGIGGDGIKNIIIKNSAARNSTANYDIASDNALGEIIDVIGTAGFEFTTGTPWANFSYEAVTAPQ